MVGPVITFRSIIPFNGGVEQHVLMSDILFLSVKEHAGKVRSDEGTLSTIGDLATLTATTGKDMYLARAQVTFFITGTAALAVGNIAELKIHGTVIETTEAALGGASTSTAGKGAAALVYEFKNIGRKVAASQIIKIEITGLHVAVDAEGFIECFEEPSGVSPFVTSEFS